MAEIQSQVINGPLGVVLAAGFMTLLAIVVMVVIGVREEGRNFNRFMETLDDDSNWSLESTAHGGTDAATNAETSEGIAGTDAATEGKS